MLVLFVKKYTRRNPYVAPMLTETATKLFQVVDMDLLRKKKKLSLSLLQN